MAISDHVTIYKGVQIGSGPDIEPYVSLGKPVGEHSELIIGANFSAGPGVVVRAGTIIGDDVNLIAQVFVGNKNTIGDRVRIGPASTLSYGVTVGSDVRIQSNVQLERIVIGDNVFVGPKVVVIDDLHPACPKYQECCDKSVVEHHVSIGAGVYIGPGITIGHHTQICAGSLLLEDVPPYSVMVGMPARRIKDFRTLPCPPGLYKRAFEYWD